ncbi:hypothetical protein ACEE06_02625 [Staphylococcus epidermidis]|uniref:hypothetical protein n=1 Tax=Staphylococcus epidermidis TaxID=1282 RepID=UPI002DBBBF1E|nr:hypothetical protein [Staphylococcus epidermidis]MEB7330279.1 hypothetical protein [Staphylococcus epidermidis]
MSWDVVMWMLITALAYMVILWVLTLILYIKRNEEIKKLRLEKRQLELSIEGLKAHHLFVYKENRKSKTDKIN